LDAAARKWLASYLATYAGMLNIGQGCLLFHLSSFQCHPCPIGDGTMVLVTHDVQLLESMDHIAEITPTGNLQVYKSCTYSQYLDLKQERAQASQAEYERNQKKAAKLQGFVDRFGASATKASDAQSRVKQIEKMEREGLLDKPDEAIVAARFRPSLILPEPPRAIGEILLALRQTSVGYDNEPLVENVNLDITRGMKLLIRGPNGAG
jgi:ATP-binding cassette, subfamily F, member 3